MTRFWLYVRHLPYCCHGASSRTGERVCLTKGHSLFVGNIRGCIQKFPDWPPGASTVNGTALCHYVHLYRYFVSRFSKFCRHNPLCCFSTNVYCKRVFRYHSVRKLSGYSLVRAFIFYRVSSCSVFSLTAFFVFLFIIIFGLQSTFCTPDCAESHISLKDITTA
jgi:hypothetical protein